MLLAVLLTGFAGCICGGDLPCGADFCDGEVRVSCNYVCPSTKTKPDFGPCHRSYYRDDCATKASASGGTKHCRPYLTTGIPACIDTSFGMCQPDAGVWCTSPQSMSYCNGFGYVEPIASTWPPGQECHQNDSTYAPKVDSPKVACVRSEYPSCVDPSTQRVCLGTVTGGYYHLTFSCGATAECYGDAGTAKCRPRDGGYDGGFDGGDGG